MSVQSAPNGPKSSVARLPGSIWALGFVSMLMDISVGDRPRAAAGVSLPPSSALARRSWASSKVLANPPHQSPNSFRARSPTSSANARSSPCSATPLRRCANRYLPLAYNVFGRAAAAQFSDRIGKGIRGAPRDALMGDLTPAGSARRQLRLAPGARHRRRRAPGPAARDR